MSGIDYANVIEALRLTRRALKALVVVLAFMAIVMYAVKAGRAGSFEIRASSTTVSLEPTGCMKLQEGGYRVDK